MILKIYSVSWHVCNDNILRNCGILLKIIFCVCKVFISSLSISSILRIYKWNYLTKNLNNHKKISFYVFSKINIHTICQNIRLFTLYPNLLSYKALSVNTIYEMKVCLNIDGVFNYLQLLFKLIFMINIHKNQKISCYFLSFFCFWKKKTMT